MLVIVGLMTAQLGMILTRKMKSSANGIDDHANRETNNNIEKNDSFY